MRRVVGSLLLSLAGSMLFPAPATAQECSRVVVFTLPGVTWEQVDKVRPPALLSMVEEGAAGSMSVRTISSRTSYASGFATIGAGSRVDAPRYSGVMTDLRPKFGPGQMFASPATVGAVERLMVDAEEAGYDAVPGALADALDDVSIFAFGNSDTGLTPEAPLGYGRWVLLAAMDSKGYVPVAYTGSETLVSDAAAPWGARTDAAAMAHDLAFTLRVRGCGVTVVDPGDLARVDELELALGRELPAEREEALLAADELLEVVLDGIDPERDLVMVVSPTSPWIEEEAHLGVAAVRGPAFDGGQTLQSASTRRAGIVTLPDIAPTVLEHLGRPPHPAMNGRPIFGVDHDGDFIDEAISLDRESIFVENMKTPITAGFVLIQVLLYAAAAGMIARFVRGDTHEFGLAGRWIELAMLCIVVFPVSTYLVGVIDQHTVGSPLIYVVLLGIDLCLALPVYFIVEGPLERLLVMCALTLLVMFADLILDGGLQLNTVLGYSPVVAGRFAGLGNIAFAVTGISGLITGALVAHRWRSPRRGLLVAALIYLAVVVFDGTPQLGSDVGGVLALVPSLGLTFLLLSGKRLNLKFLLLGAIAGVLAVAAFLAIDLSRPPEERTHLARLYEDIRDRGFGVMIDTIERKVSANVRLFRTSLWTYFVPPALVAIALLMRRPRDLWERLDESYPQVRAGFIGGLVLAALGFAVNDSGIVIPAVMLSFLVPLAIMVHLCVDRERGIPA